MKQAFAQAVDSTFSTNQKPLVRYIDNLSFTGNTGILTLELSEETFTKSNTTFLGIKPWLGIHRIGGAIFPDSSEGAPKWMSAVRRWIQYDVGEPPAEFDGKIFERDLATIREIYFNNGYFDVQVKGEIKPVVPLTPEIIPKDTLFYNVNFNITENKPTRLGKIVFIGIDTLGEDVRNAVKGESLLQTGEIYTVKKMVAERERIVNAFLNRGFALFSADSVKAFVDTANHIADVTFIIRPSRFFEFGNIGVVLHDPFEPDSVADFRETFDGETRVRTYGEQRVKQDIIRLGIAYRSGRAASINEKNETIRRLGSTGIFESMTIRTDSISRNQLHTTIDLSLLPRHQIKPELKIDNRNNAPFLSLAFGYLNRNLLGGAESFNLTSSIGLQLTYNRAQFSGIEGSRLIDELPFNFDVSGEYGLPYFTSPTSRLVVTARYNFTQPPLLLRIQNVSLRLRGQFAPNAFQRINFDAVDLEIVNYDSSRGARQLFERQNIRTELLDSLVGLGSSLNQTIRLDFTFINTNEARRWIDVKWTVLLEDAGLLTGLIDRYIDRKSRVGFPESRPQVFGLPYAEYRKATTQLAIAKFFNRYVQGAAKIQFGFMAPYGKTGETPLLRRFFAGGPNSIRAFPFNSLGPGNNSAISVSQFGADVKIETSIEYRYFFFQTIGKPSGIVLFFDGGNIWARNGANSLSLNALRASFAVGAGYGLRIGTPIGPIRLDFAYRVFDPTQPGGERWAIKKWQLDSFLFNFGIGEAF